MLTYLKTSILLSPDYEDAQVKLNETRVTLMMWLMGGEDTARIRAAIGVHKPTGQTISAELIFPFHINLLEETLRICACSLNSKLSPRLVLFRGEQFLGELYGYTSKEQLLKEGAFYGVLHQNLSGIHNDICSNALNHGIKVSKDIDLGPYAQQHLVFRNNRISHIFDPACDDFDRCDTMPITSRFDTVLFAPPGIAFINVSGSTGDGYPATTINGRTIGPASNWIAFWSFCVYAGNPYCRPACCYYNPISGYSSGHNCNAMTPGECISGNHSLFVVPGSPPPAAYVAHQPVPPPPAFDQRPTVYINAACGSSNNWHNRNTFVTQVDTAVVRLWNYYN